MLTMNLLGLTNHAQVLRWKLSSLSKNSSHLHCVTRWELSLNKADFSDWRKIR